MFKSDLISSFQVIVKVKLIKTYIVFTRGEIYGRNKSKGQRYR